MEMDTVTQIQVLNEAACISHTLGKGMHPTILPPVIGK